MQLGTRDPVSNEVGSEVFSGLLVYTMAYAHPHRYKCVPIIYMYIYTHICTSIYTCTPITQIHIHTNALTHNTYKI